MKHNGKCIGKKSFRHKNAAEALVIRNFICGNEALGIYECPTCLDFHTTSAHDNRSPELKKECEKIKKKYFAKPKERRDIWLDSKLTAHARKHLYKKVVYTTPNPNSHNQVKKRKKLEYKKSIVPLAKQKELLAILH